MDIKSQTKPVETIFLQAYESLTFWNGTRLKSSKKKKKFIFLVNVVKSALTCLPTHILWYFPHKITLKEANGLEKYDTCTCIWTWFEFRTGIHSYWSSFISTVFFPWKDARLMTIPSCTTGLNCKAHEHACCSAMSLHPSQSFYIQSPLKMLHLVHVTLHFSLSGFGDLMDGKHCITRHFLP